MHRPCVLVTGATDGIGRTTAHLLAKGGADVIVHGRNAARVATVVAEVQAIAGQPPPPPVVADLASLDEVRAAGRALVARGRPLDVLVHNAGVFVHERTLSRDGHELTFAVNHLAPFVLTHAVVDALAEAPAGRVVHVSSMAHARGRVDFDDLDGARRFDGLAAYANTKLMNVLFSNELALRLKATPATARVTSNALHPGVVTTKLLREGFGASGPDSLDDGAATSVYLALSPDVAATTGGYFVRQGPARPGRAVTAAFARRLYEVSTRLTGVTPLPAP
jgi:NAD(P)-dependent dehydrogenase (short-subunit alcohol dehydrogenase family)